MAELVDKTIDTKKPIIYIDGEKGGGQLLRTALALSTITQKSFSIKNIRAKRENPGLAPQHLMCIDALKKITNATCDAKLHDTEIIFYPGNINATKEDINIGTAGSITLLMQCLLPVLIVSKKISNFKIIGGTDVSWSPSIDYFKEIICPALSQYAKIKIQVLKRGFYPKGGGEISITIKPTKIYEPLLKITRGEQIQIVGSCIASIELEKEKIADRIKNIEELYLKKIIHSKKIQSAYAKTDSIGVITTLIAQYEHISLGVDKLGEKGISSEDIGKEIANNLLNIIESKGCCDIHLADNLIPYIGLFGGEITTSNITDHIKTNIEVTNLFLDNKKIIIEEDENKIIKIKRIENK